MEKSAFLEVLGDYPIMRVLDFLIENDVFDYSRKDIARNSGVAWNTLNTFFHTLVSKGLIIKTRKSGKSDMYKINNQNPIAQNLIEIDKKLMLQTLEQIAPAAKKIPA